MEKTSLIIKILKILKRIGIALAILLAVIILAIIILHKIYVTPKFVEEKITRLFKDSFNKEIKLKVKSISLVKGIEIEDLVLFNPEYSSKKIFFKMNRFTLKYNLFYLLLLKVRVNEIILDHPYIFLEYNENLKKWNFSDFLKPSEKKEEREKKSGSPLKIDINLKKFALINFSMEFIKGLYFKLSGINLQANAHLKETSLNGIESLNFKFFNTGKKNIIFNNKSIKIIMPLNLNVDFDIKDKSDGKLRLVYNLKDQLVELNNKFFKIPDINIIFDSNLFIKESKFVINKFLININKNPLFNITGKIKKFDTDPEIFLAMQENSLDLHDFQNLLKLLMNQESLKLNGIFQTSKLLIKKGPGQKLPSLLGKFKFKKVNFSLPDKDVNLNDLNFTAVLKSDTKKNITGNIYLNINSIFAGMLKINNFNLNSSVFIEPDNTVRSFDLFVDQCKINSGDFLVNVIYNNKELNGEIKLIGLDINEFSEAVYGNLNLRNKIKSTDMNNFDNSLNLDITNFKLITRVSNRNYYSSKMPVFIKAKQKLDLKKMDIAIQFIDVKISDFCSLLFKGDYKDNIFNGSIDEFKIITQNVISKLPENIVYNLPFQSIDGVINTTGKINFQSNRLVANIVTTNDRLFLENPDGGFKINNLYSRIKVASAGGATTVDYNFSISDVQNKTVTYNSNLKNYEIKYNEFLNRINLVSSIALDKNNIDINKLTLNIPNINFVFNLTGKVITGKDRNINLLANMIFQPDEEIHFLNNGKFDGSLNLFATVNSSLVDDSLLVNGKLLFDHLSFYMKDIIIDNVNGYLPFRHIITKNKIDRKFLISKSVKNDLQLLNYSLNRAYLRKPDNFTINKIKIKDIEIDKFSFDMEYKDNLLSLKSGYMELLDGSITINNSFFDLGNLSPETFRYKFNLEVSGVDLRKLKFIKGVKKDEDTTIFANVRIKGSGIDLQKSGDIYGAFNVTHIGNEVAAKLLSAMDPKGKDGNLSYVNQLLYGGAWCELMTLEVKYGQVFPKIWLNKAAYMVWLPLPPSPIEIKDKSLDVIIQSFKKSKEE